MKTLKLTVTGVPVIYDDATLSLQAAGRNRQERRANAAVLRRMVMPIKLYLPYELPLPLAPGEYTA